MAGDEYWRQNRVVYRRKAKPSRALLGRRRLFALGAILFALLAYAGLYQLLHLARFQVARVNVTGGDSALRPTVEEKINGLLAGDRFWLVPRSNIFLLSTRGLEDKLKASFPAIDTVEVRKTLPRELLVSLTLRVPWGIYCVGEQGPACFYIDRIGIVYREAPLVEGNLITKITSDGPVQEFGSVAIAPEVLTEFETMVKEFREHAALRITAFRLKQNAPKDYWLMTSEGFEVIVTEHDDFENVAEIVGTVLQNEIRSDRRRLEYIDARFGNKVFYKYR